MIRILTAFKYSRPTLSLVGVDVQQRFENVSRKVDQTLNLIAIPYRFSELNLIIVSHLIC